MVNEMLSNWLNYEISNIFGLIIFLALGWLATKSDIVKDVLALLLLLLLLVPVPFVMTIHFYKNSWFALVFCGVLQIGLTYLAYIFSKYMYKYHKHNKYTFWEK